MVVTWVKLEPEWFDANAVPAPTALLVPFPLPPLLSPPRPAFGFAGTVTRRWLSAGWGSRVPDAVPKASLHTRVHVRVCLYQPLGWKDRGGEGMNLPSLFNEPLALLDPDAMAKLYFSVPRFVAQLPNWGLVGVLAVVFMVVEHVEPYHREFLLVDMTIAHPFTVNERISGHFCLFIISFIPVVVISGCLLIPKDVGHSKAHLFHISLLALSLALTLNGVVTDMLKNWIGRPRPDFLARCGSSELTTTVLHSALVCTAPLGMPVLQDGFRSCPSGHTSFAFTGLGFLALWCGFQWQVLRSDTLAWRGLLGCVMPVMGALYIGVSRIIDYRHHFEDVIFGMLIGLAISGSMFYKFRAVLTVPGGEEEVVKPVLPL